jgi:ketosteroid isomerase-like protein
MSRENIEIARRAIDALNRRDVEASLSLFRADSELDWSRSRGPLKGKYWGHAGLQTFWDEFLVTFEDVHIEAHEFIDTGLEIVVPNTGYVRGRGGVKATARSTLVYTIEDGQISRLRLFQEHDEALKATSLD